MVAALVFASGVAALPAVATVDAAVGSPDIDAANALKHLSGRWAGRGQAISAAGKPEDFKCVITYFPSQDRGELKQNLRCQSDNYRLDTSTRLRISGETVTGRWEEKIYGLDGDVAGRMTASGFDVILSGKFFRASMAVSGSACEQSVKVSPERADYVREVSASLRKC
jgi:hypothetical protein